MLRDGRRVHQSTVPFSVLPDWPKWTCVPNDIKLKQFEVAFGSYKQNPALITYVGPDTVAVCPLNSWPQQSQLLQALEPDLSFSEPWLCTPKWTDAEDAVDLCQTIDSDVLKTRYLDTIFGASIELFVKSVLSRIRTAYGAKVDQYEANLRELVATPDQLDVRFANIESFSPEIQTRIENWQEANKKLLSESLKHFLVRETQVQVVLLLELEAITTRPDDLLMAHFQRLCIWQAVLGGEKDQVLQFCSHVIIPFFRSRLPERTRQLVKISRGVVYAHQRPRAKRAPLKPARIAKGQIAAQKALMKAFEVSRESSVSKLDPAKPSPTPAPLAKRSISRSMISHEKRQVQVSFGRSQQATSTPPPVSTATKAMSTKITKAPPSINSHIHVEATPQAKNRVISLPKEAVPLDFGDHVDSTDDDEET